MAVGSGVGVSSGSGVAVGSGALVGAGAAVGTGVGAGASVGVGVSVGAGASVGTAVAVGAGAGVSGGLVGAWVGSTTAVGGTGVSVAAGVSPPQAIRRAASSPASKIAASFLIILQFGRLSGFRWLLPGKPHLLVDFLDGFDCNGAGSLAAVFKDFPDEAGARLELPAPLS